MSRTLPGECVHGYIYDWGDFGCEDCKYGAPCPDGPHNKPQRCPDGCNDVALGLAPSPLARALAAIDQLRGAVEEAHDNGRSGVDIATLDSILVNTESPASATNAGSASPKRAPNPTQ